MQGITSLSKAPQTETVKACSNIPSNNSAKVISDGMEHPTPTTASYRIQSRINVNDKC